MSAPLFEDATLPAARQTMLSCVRADYARYYVPMAREYAPWKARIAAALSYGFLATLVYRYGRWTRTVRPRLLALPLKALYWIAQVGIEIAFGISISTNSDIGPGLYIGHFGGIIVCGRLGRNCSIGQGVTIGAKGAGKSNGYPWLGDDVFMGAGSMVIGAVRVGDRVVIGANTVVVCDVPDDTRVVSAPVRMSPLPGAASRSSATTAAPE